MRIINKNNNDYYHEEYHWAYYNTYIIKIFIYNILYNYNIKYYYYAFRCYYNTYLYVMNQKISNIPIYYYLELHPNVIN